MNEEVIQKMEVTELLRAENINAIYAQPAELRELLKAIYFARLDELQATKELKSQVKQTFKAFEQADKNLAAAYTRQYAKENSDVPLKFDGQGKPMATIDNFLLILRNDDYFSSLCFNARFI